MVALQQGTRCMKSMIALRTGTDCQALSAAMSRKNQKAHRVALF